MKFLIAIGSKEFSEPTLRIGMQVAHKLQSEVTILYVGEKIRSITSAEVGLAQESLERWEFNRPGVDVLAWAFHFLADHKYITPKTIAAGFTRNMLVPTDGTRSELFLQGTFSENVQLILRNGDIITELRDEVSRDDYAVTIIGGSRKRRIAHDLVQYIDSSILIVHPEHWQSIDRILLPTDDSRGTMKAVKFASRVARTYDLPVDTLTVSKTDEFKAGYRGAVKKANTFFRRTGVKVNNHYITNREPSEAIPEFAQTSHLVIMGYSYMNPLKKYIRGSKPLRVIEACRCPILVAK